MHPNIKNPAPRASAGLSDPNERSNAKRGNAGVTQEAAGGVRAIDDTRILLTIDGLS